MGAAKFSFDYFKPKQSRAIETEQRFLDALDQCLSVKSYRETTIQDIAEAAGLHRAAQSHFFEPGTYCDTGAFAATQILVTSNYFYVLNAMPALSKSPRLRHRLIGQWMVQAATLSPSAAEDDF